MNHLFISLGTTLFFLSLFQPTYSTAQNHWDADFDGLKVKEEQIKSYNVTGSGAKGELGNTTTNLYYADGKRKKVVVNYYIEGKMAHSNTSTFVYRNDSLIHIINSYVQNMKEYGIDSGQTMDVTVAWHSPLLSAKSNTYNTINDYYYGESPASVSEFQYNEDDRLYHQHILVNGVYELIIKRSYDKKGELSKINQLYTDLNSQESRETDIVFTITQSDKNGWTEMKNSIGDETTLNERELILYTEAELKDPANFYKPFPPTYSLKGLIDKLSSIFYQDSLTEKDLRLMNIVIEGLDESQEFSASEKTSLLLNFIEKKAEHFAFTNQVENAIQTAEKGLKIAEENSVHSEQKFLNMLSLLHEKKSDYKKALEFYTRYLTFDQEENFDHFGNYKKLKYASLLLKNGNKTKALEEIKSLTDLIDSNLKSFTGEIPEEEMYEAFTFYGKVESIALVLEEAGEFKKATEYLLATAKFYEFAYGRDDPAYQVIQDHLERIQGN